MNAALAQVSRNFQKKISPPAFDGRCKFSNDRLINACVYLNTKSFLIEFLAEM